MFKGFRTIVADDIKFINSDEASLYMKKNLNNIRDGMFNFFYDNYGKILDGSLMSDKLFPLGDYDIFLSHSGIDIDIVNKLAYAFSKSGIKPFVDSHAWGYYDDLLTNLDNTFNVVENKNNIITYSYEGVKRTASHVHMILSTALNKMIDKCEFFLFVETKNSVITLQDQKKTLSPWIMSELETSKIIRRHSKYEHDMIIEDAQIKTGLEYIRIAYTIPTDHLIYINWDDLVSYLCFNKHTKKLLYETLSR